jgi:hypothetical protein
VDVLKPLFLRSSELLVLLHFRYRAVNSLRPAVFQAKPGAAKYVTPEDPKRLQESWNCITQKLLTDIIYVGKADKIRNRVRKLVKFGAGKARNHKGGEWLWQISKIETANLLVQSCPPGKQIAFENWLLEQFCKEHGRLPIANRDGPEGADRWRPV